jgi:putative membrane protein
VIASTAFGIAVVVDALAGQATGETGESMDHMLSGAWGSGMLLWILFWVGLLVLVTALALWLMDQRRDRQPEEDALEILRQRYARGEIDGQEFKEKQTGLG